MKINRRMMTEIFERMATSDLGYEQIMSERKKAHKSFISTRTVYRWLDADEALRHQAARAKDEQADLLHYRAQQQAAHPLIGTVKRTETSPDGKKIIITVSDNVERSKLLVQTTLRRAGELAPKKYGRNTPGESPDNPIHIKVDREEILGKLLGNRANPAAAGRGE